VRRTMHILDVVSSVSRSSKCTKIVGGWGFTITYTKFGLDTFRFHISMVHCVGLTFSGHSVLPILNLTAYSSVENEDILSANKITFALSQYFTVQKKYA